MTINRKQKLELTWIGKENRPKLEPRILLEDPEKSYHAAHRVTDQDLFDSRLIFGDNLLALKALEQEFSGRLNASTSILRTIQELPSRILMTVSSTLFGCHSCLKGSRYCGGFCHQMDRCGFRSMTMRCHTFE